jgi:exportin-5
MHAASLMVKIAQKYPLLLLPLFERVYATVQGLSKDPEQLSRLERVTLQVHCVDICILLLHACSILLAISN